MLNGVKHLDLGRLRFFAALRMTVSGFHLGYSDRPLSFHEDLLTLFAANRQGEVAIDLPDRGQGILSFEAEVVESPGFFVISNEIFGDVKKSPMFQYRIAITMPVPERPLFCLL